VGTKKREEKKRTRTKEQKKGKARIQKVLSARKFKTKLQKGGKEMKQTINSYDFHRGFEKLRPDNFSYNGLDALFNFLEEWEEDTGETTEFDVISICCDYSEYKNAAEAVKDYSGEEMTEEEALEYLQDRTTIIEFNGGIIIQNY